MTLRPWLARALRRFVGTSAMMVGGLAALDDFLHATPELPPPAGVDRVQVATEDGSHTITDPATVARIVAIVRGHQGELNRFPEIVCLLSSRRATFYQGATPRGSISWGTQSIEVTTRGEIIFLSLTPRRGAELVRLLGPASMMTPDTPGPPGR